MKESDDILRKMLTETREIPVDHVPYAFEKRIMAHIEAAPQAAINLWQQWSQALWRAVVPCLAVMILVAVLDSPEATGRFPYRPFTRQVMGGLETAASSLARLQRSSHN